MKSSFEEIQEIFRVNQLACNNHVMPSIDEWNKVGAFISEVVEKNNKADELIKFLDRRIGDMPKSLRKEFIEKMDELGL